MTSLRIGIDFDNTIVCYDGVFHRAAIERGYLAECECALSKGKVRDRLRAQGMEEEWIDLQGYVYGAAMHLALPYPGIKDFLEYCRNEDVSVFIISHKTKHPFRGPRYDLHKAARGWLKENEISGFANSCVTPGNTFFELTKEKKIRRIGDLGCTHFIDDLPEFLRDEAWPQAVQRLLFDPDDHYVDVTEFCKLRSWREGLTWLKSKILPI